MSQCNWYRMSFFFVLIVAVSGACAMQDGQKIEEVNSDIIICDFRQRPHNSFLSRSMSLSSLSFDSKEFKEKYSLLFADKSIEDIIKMEKAVLAQANLVDKQQLAKLRTFFSYLQALRRKKKDYYSSELEIFASEKLVIPISKMVIERDPNFYTPLIDNNIDNNAEKLENVEQKRFEPIMLTAGTIGVVASVGKVVLDVGAMTYQQYSKRKKKRKEKKEKEEKEREEKEKADWVNNIEPMPFTTFLAPECFPTLSPVSSSYSNAYNHVEVHYPNFNTYNVGVSNSSEMVCAGVQSMQGPLRASHSSSETDKGFDTLS